MTGLVIIGAGQAGAQLAISLRESNYSGPITLIGDEARAPYHRPPLSKDYLRGDLPEGQLYFRGLDVYQREEIELRLDETVVSINCNSRSIELVDGSMLSYDRLVFATGARGRDLPWSGDRPDNVYALRTFDDAHTLRNALDHAKHALVIGAGFIGLEFATVARANGLNVTVAEMADRAMGRAVSEPVSRHFTELHRADGVHMVLGSGVSEFFYDNDGNVVGAQLDGEYIPVDVLVVGIGVLANSELASDAGLVVENGVVVDSFLRTGQPGVYAIGDCARFPDPQSGDLVRLESVPNAAEQARYLAGYLAGQTEQGYDFVPWFWSVQAGARLQIAGRANPEDEVVALPSSDDKRFSVARVRAGKLVAVESINQPAEHMAARKIFTEMVEVSAADLDSPEFSLKQAARRTSAKIRS